MEYWMNELYHHGIKGQRWGNRRYQNDDGSLTPAGRQRYLKDPGDMDYVEKSITKKMDKLAEKSEKYEQKARDIMNTKIGKAMASDVAARYTMKAKKAIDKMNVGGAMLKSYREMPKRNRDSLRDDTSYNFQIRNGINDVATKDMNKKEKREFKRNSRSYRFS